MKKSLVVFVSAVALALVMVVPSKASAQYGWGWGGGGVNIYIGPRYPPTATLIRLTVMDMHTRIMVMDTHIRVTATADTTHTGVVTRGVPGGAGIRGQRALPAAAPA